MNRRGISLLEVLFSMLLVTVGLFGAIALLPVAAHTAKKGRTSDAIAVVGESSVSEFHVRGMNNVQGWYSPVANFFTATYLDMGGNPIPNVTARYYPPVGFCIDPIFVASNSNVVAAETTPPSPEAGTFGTTRFFPCYNLSAPGSTGMNNDYAARMERISLTSAPGATTAMNLQHAMSIFVSDDDLLTDRVSDATVPASQIYSRTADNLRRLSANELSWLITLEPIARFDQNKAPDSYTMNVVLLYKRPLTSLAVDTDYYTDYANTQGAILAPERLVDVITFAGNGIGGGEVTLQYRTNRGAPDIDLRAGDWMMLSGSQPIGAVPFASLGFGNVINPDTGVPSTATAVRWDRYNDGATSYSVRPDKQPAFGWYKVISVDDIDPTIPNQRNVTLHGADWRLGDSANWPTDMMGNKQSITQATIVSGVVAVFQKTVTLRFK